MGVKRFLVAGGMASLVLIGVVLIVDAKGLAKNNESPVTRARRLCNDSSA